MARQNTVNLSSAQGPNDAVRKKYVNEKFIRRDAPIDMKHKAIKNVLSPVDEGNAANKSYVDPKSVGGSDLDMIGHSIKNSNPNPMHGDELVPKQWIENNFLSRDSPASTMAGDLNSDGHQITYLKEPERNHHGVTKGDVNTRLSLEGGNLRGDLGMLGHNIKNFGDPLHNNDAVRKTYVDEGFLRRDGTTGCEKLSTPGVFV